MKITVITETYLPFIAGVSTSTDSIANFLEKNGHEVTIIAPKPILPFNSQNSKIKLIYTPSLKDPFFPGKPTSPIPLPIVTLVKSLTKEKTDLVHIQEAGAVGITAFIIAKIRKIKIVGALHFTPEQVVRISKFNPLNLTVKIINFYLKLFYNSCDGIMVPTQTFTDFLKSIGVRKKIIVVSNGVETQKFLPGKKNKEIISYFNLPENKIFFFYMGRIDKDKHLEFIIKALPKTFPEIHLILAGNGKEEISLKKLAEQFKVENRISWLGFIPQEKMVSLYQVMDCFVIMSPYEVQSIVTLQAISCGLPVIAVNKGALPELVKDSVNGFLIEKDDFNSLCDKMNLLAKNEPLRKKMGEESRKIALPHEKLLALKKLENFYYELLQK